MGAPGSAAPGRLETVRRFVNTSDIEAATDTLTTPERLVAWLCDAELLGREVTADQTDLRRAVELREALRSAMASNHDGAPVAADAVATLNETADRAGLQLAFTADPRWAARPTAKGVDAALGTLLAVVAAAMTEDTWRRLKVCANDACRWAFYDHSRARAGKWCSMQACGNRVKQQAWRARREGEQR
ncbi:CGNR zinc finger domain-containing protein [Actinotalea ferrariae]|uniref:CGNR zinc finger domain-containing protein n=1 Tax=Actinotalea ferrariae TaxID=1386098 RepID=UPI001C8BD098|nr:ABATE domain-containing protein [Actinotalea ferrariae]MBX9244113.1 CGNR zinc finger domain-containing protein [Actinotalea ferrariae]